MRSLRSRLLIGTGAGMTVVLVVSGILLYALIRRALWDESDAALAARARSLAAMIECDGDELELELGEADLPEYAPSEHNEFYQVWINEGEVVAKSASLEDRDLDLIAGSLEQPAYRSAVLPDGRAGRLAGIRFVPRADNEHQGSGQPLEVTLVIGRETADIENTLARIGAVMIAVGLAAVLVSVGVLAWFVRRGLKPVDRLAAQIGNVGESDLGARIEPAGVPSELLPVVERLNDLLRRLESAFQCERRFTADVAHELRTPLAGVRSMLEVALSRPREPDAYRDTMKGCLDINRQMHQMVENLLSLARADAHQLEVTQDRFDVSALVRECWKSLADQADQKRLSVTWSLQEPCPLQSDRSKLHLVIQNILSNAVTYANEGGGIAVESIADHGQVELTVSNTGSTLSQQEAERVFDRFWRKDPSRQSGGQHCGLGLALCKTLVDLLGGSISARSTPDGELILSVVLACGGNRNRGPSPGG